MLSVNIKCVDLYAKKKSLNTSRSPLRYHYKHAWWSTLWAPGTDLRRPILTSMDVRIWRLSRHPHWKSKLFIMAVDGAHTIGIQMKEKELTKTCMMTLNWKKPFGLLVYIKIFQLTWKVSRYCLLALHDSVGTALATCPCKVFFACIVYNVDIWLH